MSEQLRNVHDWDEEEEEEKKLKENREKFLFSLSPFAFCCSRGIKERRFESASFSLSVLINAEIETKA
jgi:hypothetical protein